MNTTNPAEIAKRARLKDVNVEGDDDTLFKLGRDSSAKRILIRCEQNSHTIERP